MLRLRGNIIELPFIKLTLYLSLSFRNQSILNKAIIASTKNSQQFFAWQVSVFKDK